MKDYFLILVDPSTLQGQIQDISYVFAMNKAKMFFDFDSPLEALKYAVSGINNKTISTDYLILLYSTSPFKLIHY